MRLESLNATTPKSSSLPLLFSAFFSSKLCFLVIYTFVSIYPSNPFFLVLPASVENQISPAPPPNLRNTTLAKTVPPIYLLMYYDNGRLKYFRGNQMHEGDVLQSLAGL
ncbi:hypothetical protein V6N13_044408 [Hibiscus sabdariffa]